MERIQPKHMRAMLRVDLSILALRMGIPVADLRTLEATPTDSWQVRDLRGYMAALGCSATRITTTALGRVLELDEAASE